jgi:hypothetical protein
MKDVQFKGRRYRALDERPYNRGAEVAITVEVNGRRKIIVKPKSRPSKAVAQHT